MTETASTETLRRQVESWVAGDPDPRTRAELQALLERGAWEELEERFADGLRFGTAGLRARLGAGPSRMNPATVRRTSAGLARYLLRAVEGACEQGVVVGHDARHASEPFAREAAAVISGAGLRTYRLPPLAPTPLLAFAVRHLGCAAGVMVTASHNPPQDNGYKVYLGDGAQIAPPADEQIAADIERVGRASELPLGDGGEQTGGEVSEAYLAAVLDAMPDVGDREVRAVYTPLHGVGAPLFLEAFGRAGFPAPVVVAAQAKPDPDFRTVDLPNPEEPGTLDLALAEAADRQADLLLVNDPDADRLAVAIPEAGGWRRLHGDEVGACLADFLLEHCPDPERALLVTTVASSTLLRRMAEAAGARYTETLTGCKWIMRALADAPGHRLLLGYEEALGYAVSEDVRDKDGISAALVVAQLAATEKRAGRTLGDRLDAIAARFGVHATTSLTLEIEGRDGLQRMTAIMDRLRASPPRALLGRPIESIDDVAASLRREAGGGEEPLALPRSDVLVLRAERVRVVVRPSGTEPKLKAYLEVVTDDRREAAAQLDRLRDELSGVLDDG
jgi:phosphomannomutase